MYLKTNLKKLRLRKGVSQELVAKALGISRQKLTRFETQDTTPEQDVLVKMSDYYGITLDALIKVDLTKLSELQFKALDNGFDVFLKGSNIRVLATTVDKDNRDNIELVNHKAKAGYLSGFADLEYIETLPTFQLPFLRQDRKYRCFEVEGDSMPPLKPGDFVIGEYVEDWTQLKNGLKYIIVTNEGIAIKIVYKQQNSETILLASTNPIYPPYEINLNNLTEIWTYKHNIASQ